MKTCFWTFLLPLMSVAQTSVQPQLMINGKIAGLPDNSRVYISNPNNAADTVASAVVLGGTFTLKGKVIEPSLFEINFEGLSKKLPLFVGNDNITMNGTVKDFDHLQVTGSASFNDFSHFQEIFTPYLTQLNGLAATINARPGISRDDTLMKQYLAVLNQLQVAQDAFLQNNKSSYVSPFMLFAFARLSEDVLLLERRFNQLSPQVQNSLYGNSLKQTIAVEKIGAIGTDEIDFTQNDPQGRPISLSSFKGKYVLVDFWASWCHPCRMENPNVVAVFNKFKAKNFTILSVSLDREKNPWLQAIKDDNLTWTHVSDLKFWNNDVALKYHVQTIPQNFLVDPSGKIVAKNLRGGDLESKLCEFLGCN
jgi:thiol-disulfide isomerase/thioredoxin